MTVSDSFATFHDKIDAFQKFPYFFKLADII